MAKKVKIDSLKDEEQLPIVKNSQVSDALNTDFKGGYGRYTPTKDDLNYVDFTKFSPLTHDLNEIKATNQEALDRTGRILTRGLATFGTATAETIAGIASLVASPFTYDGEKGYVESTFNNSLMKGIEELHKDILDNRQLYYTKEELADESITGWLAGGKFADDLTQGAAFLASQVIPASLIGKLVKSVTFLTKIGKTGQVINEAGVASKFFEGRTLKALANLSKEEIASLAAEGVDVAQLQKTIGNTQRILDKVGNGVGATVGRLGESTMERNQTYNELIAKGVDKKTAIEQSNNVFWGNMALAVLDAKQYTQMFGAFSKGAKKGLVNEMYDDVTKLLFKKGDELAATQMSKGAKIGNYLWGVGKQTGIESYEELQQFSFQEAAKNLALKANNPEYTDSIFSFLGESFKGLPQSLASVEGQRSAILGGLLGGGVTSISTRGQQGAIQKMANETVADFNNNSVYQKEKVDPTKRFITTPTGEKVANNSYLSELNRFTGLEEAKIIAADKKDFIEWDRLNNLQLFGQVESYKKAGMLDELVSKYENLAGLSTTELAAELKTNPSELEDPKLTVDNINKKIKHYSELLDSVASDPTLSALDKKAQRAASVKLFNYEENKNQLNKIAGRINELQSKNDSYIINTRFDSETDTTSLGNRTKGFEKLDGLNPSEQVELRQLKTRKDKLATENENVLSWFTDVRKPENLAKFNKDIEDFSVTNNNELVEAAAKKEKAKINSPEVMDFYNRNVVEDEEGFESSDIEVTDELGNKQVWTFQKDSPEVLFDSNGKVIYKTQDFLDNSFKEADGSYSINDSQNRKYTITTTKPFDKRTIRKNKAEIVKLEARVFSLDIIINNLKKKLTDYKKQTENKIAEKNKELALIIDDINTVKDGRTKRSNAYKALLESKNTLENEIIDLEIELESYVQNRPNIVKRGVELREEQNKLKEKIEYIKANLKKGFTSIEKEKLENNVSSLEQQIEIENEFEKVYNDVIADKREYLTNLKKVVNAINHFLSGELDKLIDKYPSVINTIIEKYNIQTSEEFFNWIKNYKENVTDVYEITYLNTSPDFKKLLEEALTSVEDSELDKYTNEIFDLEKELAVIENQYQEYLNSKTENLAKLQFLLDNAIQELKYYNKYYDKLTNKQPANPIVSQDFVETSTDLTAPKNGKKIDINRSGKFVTAGNDGWEENEMNPNIEERRWYRFLENEAFKLKGLKLMTVTINDKNYGINAPKSIYKEPEIKGVTHTIDDIRFIVVDETNTPIVFAGDIVTGKMRTDSNTFTNGEMRYYSSDSTISEEAFINQLNDESEKLNAVREKIKSNELNFYFPVTFVNRGTNLNANPSNVVGTLVNNDKELEDLTIEISTGKIQKGSFLVNYPSGRVLIKQNDTIIPAITRTIDKDTEGRTVLELTKLLAKNILAGKPDEKPKDFKYSIQAYINNIVYTGNSSNNNFSILDDKTILLGDKVITFEELLSGKFDNDILDLLATKTFQVNNNKWLNDTKKQYHQIAFVEGQFKNFTYESYKHFLLTSKNSPLKVAIKTALPNATNEQILNDPDFRRFQNGYIMYSPVFNDGKTEPIITEKENLSGLSEELAALKNKKTATTATPTESAPTSFGSFFKDNILSKLTKKVKSPKDSEEKSTTQSTQKEPVFTEKDAKINSALEKLLGKKSPLNRLNTKGGVLINLETAKQNLAAILNVSVETITGKLIDGIADGQLTSDGRILLSDLAEEGTEYHEAFHRVSQFLLTKEERENLYNEYRKKSKQSLTNLEIEELLAEDFRNYALNNNKTSTNKSFFDKIINFIKNLFSLEASNSNLINNLFNSIILGEFKNKEALVESMDYDKLNSNNSNKARIFNAYFSEILDNQPELYAILSDSSYNTDVLVKEIYKQAAIKFAKAALDLDLATEEGAKLATEEEIDAIQKYIEAHKKYIKNVGLLVSDNVDNIFNENENNFEEEKKDEEASDVGKRDSEDYREGFESSSVSNVFKSIKLLIAGLTVNINNNLKATVNYEKTLNKVANTVADSVSYTDMLTKLKSSNDLALHQLADKLGEITKNTDETQIGLIKDFYTQFAKNKNVFYKGIYNEEENTIGLSNANTTSIQDKIRVDWLNKLKYIKPNNIIKIVNGKIILIDTKERNTPILAKEFLDGLGLDTSFLSVNYMVNNLEVLNDIYSFILAVKTLPNKDITLILDKQKSDLKNRVEKILNILASVEGNIIENKASTAKGATVFGLTNGSNYTKTIDKINNGVFPNYLIKDSYCKDSLILNTILNPNKGETYFIEKIINSGLAKANKLEGEDTSKLSYSDLVAYDFCNNLEGIQTLLPTGDKKTPRAFAFKRKVGNSVTTVSLVDLQKGQKTYEAIVDEITTKLYNYYKTESSLKPRKEKILPKGESQLGEKTLFDAIFEQFPSIQKQNSIKQFLEFTIKENKELFKNTNVLTTNNSVLTANLLNKLIGKNSVNSENDVNLLTAAFTGNNILSAIEQTKLFFGHPAFYKDFIDLFKRYAGEVAETNPLLNDQNLLDWYDNNPNYARKDGKKRDGKFSTLVVEDIEVYIKELAELNPAYAESNEADAYGIIFDDFFRDVHLLSNKWSEDYNNQWLKEYDGEQGELQIPAASKLLAFGSQEENLLRPFYLKFATFRVGNSLMEVIKEQKGSYPQLNTLLQKVSDLAKEGNYVDMVVFKSGNKVGTKVNSKGVVHPFYANNGTISDIDSQYLSTLSLSDIGIQVENNAKDSFKTTRGTQAAALEYSNLFENGQPIQEQIIVNGKFLTVENAVKESFAVQNELTDALKEQLKQELDMVNSSKGYIFKDGGKKLLKVLVEEQLKRDGSDNDIEGVISELKKLKTSDSIMLEKLVNKVKLEYILSSIVSNKVINQTRHGLQAVQFPSTGFEFSPRTKNENGKWNTSDSITFYENSLGKMVMQVYLPYNFKGKIKGNIIEQYDEKLKQMYGFRIPTEQLNSIDVIEVAGYLPKSYGNCVVVPTGITTKVGSDFDFDKINMYFPNYETKLDLKISHFKNSSHYNNLSNEYKKELNKLSDNDFYSLLEDLNNYSVSSGKGFKGNLNESQDYINSSESIKELYDNLKDALVNYNSENKTKIKPQYIEYNQENLNNPKTKIKALENRMLELSIGLVSANFRKAEHLSPNSIADVYNGKDNPSIVTTIREAKMKVNPSLLKDDYNNFNLSDLFRYKIISELRNKFWYGKDLIGIFALHNKNHVIAQIAGLKIKSKFPVNFDGIVNNLDNEDIIHPLGNLTDTKGYYISSTTGQSVSLAADIAKNPDILPVLNLNEITADAALFLMRRGVAKDTVFYFISQPIIKEYVSQLATSKGWLTESNASKNSIIKNLLSKYPKSEGVVFNDDMLLSYNNKYQAQILEDFINYQSLGSELSEFQRAVAFDRLDYKTQDELDYALFVYEKAMKNSNVVNKEEYVDTFIKGFYNATLDTKNFWNNLFLSKQLPIFEEIKTLKETIYNKISKKADRNRTLNLITNDLLAYIITNTNSSLFNSSINDSYDSLMKGQNSVAKQLEAFKEANPKYTALNNLVADINHKETGIDNIKLFSKKLTSYEIDEIVETLRDIAKLKTPTFNGNKFISDLIKVSFLQTGFNFSAFNYNNILPSITKNNEMSFSGLINSITSKLNVNDINIEEAIELIHLNNISNNNLVPYYKKRKPNFEKGNLLVDAETSYVESLYLKRKEKDSWIMYRRSGINEEGKVIYKPLMHRNKEGNSKDFRPLKINLSSNKPIVKQENKIDFTAVISSLVLSYNKMSNTKKVEFANLSGIKNVQEFEAVMNEILTGNKITLPETTELVIEKMRDIINDCFKGKV